MSEQQEKPDPLIVEIAADTSGAICALQRAQAGFMFAFHPDLTTPAERAARHQFLRAWGAAEDFRDSTETLITQAGVSPEEVQSLQDAVRRIASAGPVRPDEEPTT